VQQRPPTDDDDETAEDEASLALGGDKILLTCTGVGFRNLSKVVL